MTVDHHGANSCTITGLTSGDNYVLYIYTEDSAGTAMDQAAVTATAAAALAGTDTCQSQVACAVDTGACTTNYPAVLGCTDPINTWTYTYGIGDELVGVCTDQGSGDCATHADVCSTSTGYETVRACTALAAAENSYVAMTGSANDIAVREPCNDFAAVSSVASCSACSTGTAIEDCTAGVCAEGYHTFVDGDATTTACSPCSEVLNAAADATYTCTGDSDSDVSACLDGFWEDTTGTASVCTACTTVGDAASAATYTCISASDSDVSACLDGYWEDRRSALSIVQATYVLN